MARWLLPVIAIVLAIVIGFVLYLALVSTQKSTSPSKVTVTFHPVSSMRLGTTYFDNFSLGLTSVISSSQIGFVINTGHGAAVSAGSAIGRCAGLTVDTCTASSQGWFLVLASGVGAIEATYDAELWDATVSLQNGWNLVLVSPNMLAGSFDVLSAVASSNLAVTGSAIL